MLRRRRELDTLEDPDGRPPSLKGKIREEEERVTSAPREEDETHQRRPPRSRRRTKATKPLIIPILIILLLALRKFCILLQFSEISSLPSPIYNATPRSRRRTKATKSLIIPIVIILLLALRKFCRLLQFREISSLPSPIFNTTPRSRRRTKATKSLIIPIAIILFLALRQFCRLLQFREISSLPSPMYNATPPGDADEFALGVYTYGPNKHVLIITGASVTSDYHSRQTLWFQFFALGERLFARETMPYNSEPCLLNSDGIAAMGPNGATEPLKSWEDMKEEVFYCGVGGRTARFELMPSVGVDSNTNRVLQVWRCPLHGVPGRAGILSSSDVRNFLKHPSKDEVLVVDLLHEERRKEPWWWTCCMRRGGRSRAQGSNLTMIARVPLPSTDPTVGLNRGMFSNPTKPLGLQRHNITLCTVAQANGLASLNQFIRYHNDMVGIDHIHIGIETLYNKTETESVLRIANSLLGPEIDAGRVSTSALWDGDLLGVQCPHREIPKQIFYQNCLYRAKSTSEFVATWDIDEYILLLKEEEMTAARGRSRQSLPDFLRGIEHPECPDWSYVTMKSSKAGGGVSGHYHTGLAALDYPVREREATTTWQKSVGRSKNVFLNSFHLPGSCLPEGKSQASDAIKMSPTDGKCAFYIDEAIMIHMRGLPYRGDSKQIHGPTVPNELGPLLRSA